MKSKLFFLFIIILWALWGCDNYDDSPRPGIDPPDDESTPSSNGIFPLKVGNYWTYHILDVTDSTSYELTWQITGTHTINEQIVFVLGQFRNGHLQPEHRYLRNRGDGLYIYHYVDEDGQAHLLDQAHMMLLYPAEDNDHFLPWAADDGIHRVAQKNIQVPAGTFYCEKYELYYPDHMQTEFWYPDVGLISLYYYENAQLLTIWSLESYRLY